MHNSCFPLSPETSYNNPDSTWVSSVHTSISKCRLSLLNGPQPSLKSCFALYIIIGCFVNQDINPLMPNDPYRGCATMLTSKCCILYIYSTNVGTEYFKHGIYSRFISLQNSVCFIILTYLVPVLFTFYIQDVLKLKK